MPAKKNLFMQSMKEEQDIRGTEGSLHHMLGFSPDYNMGDAMSLLEKIKNSPIGSKFKNPLKLGKKEIHVTYALKKKAVGAWVRINASRGMYKKR